MTLNILRYLLFLICWAGLKKKKKKNPDIFILRKLWERKAVETKFKVFKVEKTTIY